MKIFINNEPTVVHDATTVSEIVLATLRLNPVGMAIAINETIVPKHLWESTRLHANDKMLVIKACSGG